MTKSKILAKQQGLFTTHYTSSAMSQNQQTIYYECKLNVACNANIVRGEMQDQSLIYFLRKWYLPTLQTKKSW